MGWVRKRVSKNKDIFSVEIKSISHEHSLLPHYRPVISSKVCVWGWGGVIPSLVCQIHRDIQAIHRDVLQPLTLSGCYGLLTSDNCTRQEARFTMAIIGR